MITLLAAAAIAGSPGFYPGSSSVWQPLDADGTVRGHARTGEVVVRIADVAALAGHPDIASLRPLRGHVAVITPRAGVDDVALAVALRGRADVRWAHPNLIVPLRAQSNPDDPYLADQWHLENTGQQGFTPGVDIGAFEAWDVTHGAGQLVAILDTGVDIEHPDLQVIDGHDYIDQDDSSDPIADDAHGTACAGLAVGRGDNGLGTSGVAYDATAYGIRLIGDSTLTDLYDAFVEAVDAGATVLSNSWGFADDCAGIPDYGIIEESFDYAEEEGRGGLGSAVVFAAGNGNCDIRANDMLANPTVITVAAVSGFDVRESYSNFGPWVDIAAPSGGMYTTDIIGSAGYNGYPGDDDYTTWFNGTSASTPVVAGVVALMFAANDRLTPADVRDALCDTAVRVDLAGGGWDDTGWSPFYGCGRVHAGAAVRAVANLGPPALAVPDALVSVDPSAAVFTWAETPDPDGDIVSYTFRWAFTNASNAKTLVETERPWVDLTGVVADGDAIEWQVRSADLWGETDWSALATTAVITPVVVVPKPVEETGGCAHAPVAPLAALAGIGLLRRRSRQAPSAQNA